MTWKIWKKWNSKLQMSNFLDQGMKLNRWILETFIWNVGLMLKIVPYRVFWLKLGQVLPKDCSVGMFYGVMSIINMFKIQMQSHPRNLYRKPCCLSMSSLIILHKKWLHKVPHISQSSMNRLKIESYVLVGAAIF